MLLSYTLIAERLASARFENGHPFDSSVRKLGAGLLTPHQGTFTENSKRALGPVDTCLNAFDDNCRSHSACGAHCHQGRNVHFGTFQLVQNCADQN